MQGPLLCPADRQPLPPNGCGADDVDGDVLIEVLDAVAHASLRCPEHAQSPY